MPRRFPAKIGKSFCQSLKTARVEVSQPGEDALRCLIPIAFQEAEPGLHDLLLATVSAGGEFRFDEELEIGGDEIAHRDVPQVTLILSGPGRPVQ
jgi:hypothetical protein